MRRLSLLAQKLDDAREKGIEISKQEGIKIGHEKGREEGKIEVAQNLLKAGESVDLIAESTGLPKAEIAQLKEEVTS